VEQGTIISSPVPTTKTCSFSISATSRDDLTGFSAHIAGGADVIDLQGYGLTFASRLSSFTRQVGTDAVIDFKNGDILTLHNVQVSGLQASDFLLV
jgi:hypothetical protein